MAKKPIYIQLEAGEDVASVRDRLSFIRGQRVLLIWPEAGTALQRKLDLVLVQREARRRALQIALVTHDPQVISGATDLGISTFETIGASERGRWQRPRAKVFTQRHHRPEDAPEPDDLMAVASRVRRAGRRLPPLTKLALRLAILGVLLAAVGGLVYVVLPGAVVQIALAQTEISVTADITANPAAAAVDLETATIPATTLRASVVTTGSISTSGLQELEDVVAGGAVVFTNQTETPVTVPAGTVVSTSAGTPILFRTLEEVIVPGGTGERADANIEAMTAGEAGNVDGGLINTVVGPLDNLVTVRNLAPTVGGLRSTIATVTAADRSRLLGIVRGELQSLAFTEMQTQLSETQFIIIETIRIAEERNDWTTFSHNTGDIADVLSLTMRAEVEAIAVDDRFGRQITLARLSSQIPRGYSIIPDSFIYSRGAITTGEAGQIIISATGSASISQQVNTSRLRERLAGLSLPDALDLLRLEVDMQPGSQPAIIVSPDWYGAVPLLPIRIEIQFTGNDP